MMGPIYGYFTPAELEESQREAAEKASAKTLATPPAPAAVTEGASEPFARLFVSMERHDMGQSLAPPPPPFRFVQARALPAADGLPVGEYDLCLATTSTAAQPESGVKP